MKLPMNVEKKKNRQNVNNRNACAASRSDFKSKHEEAKGGKRWRMKASPKVRPALPRPSVYSTNPAPKKIGCFPSQERGASGRFALLRAIVFVWVLLLLLLLLAYQIGWLKFYEDGLLIVTNYTFIHPPQNVLMSAAPRMARVTSC